MLGIFLCVRALIFTSKCCGWLLCARRIEEFMEEPRSCLVGPAAATANKGQIMSLGEK
jgi:hypothetical protein